MPQEDYAKLVTTIQLLSYEQRLNLLSLLVASLQENYSNPEFITGLSRAEINSKLDEAYDSMKDGNCYSVDEVDAMLKEEIGIWKHGI